VVRYQEVGCPVFTIFFFWRVTIITLDPEDIKVWSKVLHTVGYLLDSLRSKLKHVNFTHAKCQIP